MNHLNQSISSAVCKGSAARLPNAAKDNFNESTSSFDNIHVETMTLNELAAFCRRIGISTSEVTLADGIEQGVFPYGICIKNPVKETRQFVIYKQLVLDYYTERAMRYR